MTLELLLGDCRQVMAGMAESSVDAIVTDPPYDLTAGKRGGSGLASLNPASPAGRSRISTGFMGKRWDGTGVAFEAATWVVASRVLKPGAHLVAFGGTRTHHRLMVALEEAGFEIRDCLMWLFGSGFPKSLNLGNGWGTALKPAYEPIVLARKPLKGRVVDNVEAYGTGGLNIDRCRIDGAKGDGHWSGDDGSDSTSRPGYDGGFTRGGSQASGRWPATVVLDGAAARQLDAQSGEAGAFAPVLGTEPSTPFGGPIYGDNGRHVGPFYADQGGASRFFYTSKAQRDERDFGLDDLAPKSPGQMTDREDGKPGTLHPRSGAGWGLNRQTAPPIRRNDHPTVKPVDLMAWLCRLVTPPGGIILDPFLGSGSTGMAALDEGFGFIGIEIDANYLEIARRRIRRRHLLDPLPQPTQGQANLL